MKPRTKFNLIALLLAFVLAACSLDGDLVVFILHRADSSPSSTATVTATIGASPTASATNTPLSTPTPTISPTVTPTFEPSPTREVLNRVQVSANVNIRSAPNGSVVRVAPAGSEFDVLSRRDDWLNVPEGWLFFGEWVTFVSGSIDAVPSAAPARSRISYNINAQSVDNWTVLWAHLEALQPTTVLFMNGINRACEAVRRLPNTLVIHRQYSSAEGDEWAVRPNEQEWVAQWQAENAGLPADCRQIVRYATNEASFGDVALWAQSEIELMDAAHAAGIRVAVGNLGVGRLPDWAINGGLLDGWIRAVVRGNHIVGAHEYAQPIIPNGVGIYSRAQMTDANAMQPENWAVDLPIAYLPFVAQSLDELDPVTMPFGDYEQALAALDAPILAQSVACGGRLPSYWHILRTTFILLRAACIGIDPDLIEIVNTEGLWDRTDDLNIPGVIEPIKVLERDFGLPRYFNDLRGVNSYIRLWQAWYPFWSAADAIVCQLVWWDHIAPSQYLGVNIFTWSRVQQWNSFDMSGPEGDYLYEVHRDLEFWAAGGDMREICGDYDWIAA